MKMVRFIPQKKLSGKSKTTAVVNSLKVAASIFLCASGGALQAAEFNLQTASVVDIQAAFDSGKLTAVQLVKLCQARIDAYDQVGPKINSVIAVNPRALEIAAELDLERAEKGPRSPIHGIPVLLKDNYDTYDMPTTGASKALVGSMAPDDAYTVKKMRDAGAIIFAKVNLSELARSGVSISSLMGQTLNPYDLTRTPGGSSGGTGAAIGATFGILGTGSDTGQSTRSPASANSLVGVRPTFGLISRDGIIPISYTQDTGGPIARFVADAAVMMDYMVGFDYKDPSTWEGVGQAPDSYTHSIDPEGLKGARIGYVVNLFGKDPIHENVNRVTHQQIENMKVAGATVFPVDIPVTAAYFEDLSQLSVGNYESAYFMDRYFETLGPDAMYKNFAEYVAAGLTHPPILKRLQENLKMESPMTDPGYILRLKRQKEFKATLVGVMDEYGLDALFYPHQRRLVVPTGPNPVQVDRNGFMASSSGLPAITVPGGFSDPTEDAPIGVPIGVEFLGRPFDEPLLFKLASGFEAATKNRKDPVSAPALPGEKFCY
jgi:amidase